MDQLALIIIGRPRRPEARSAVCGTLSAIHPRPAIHPRMEYTAGVVCFLALLAAGPGLAQVPNPRVPNPRATNQPRQPQPIQPQPAPQPPPQTQFSGPVDPPPTTANVLGQPLPGLTVDENANFEAGLAIFGKTTPVADGLGPVFNGTACAECHKAGAIGGAATDTTTARVTRFGGLFNGVYTDLKELGGPVLQARSLHEFNLAYPGAAEVVPPQAQFVSHRMTTAIFGDGLIEAIPDATILATTTRPDPDGVHGMVNYIFNPEDNRNEMGRFGWKAQMPTLHLFGGDAYLNEMGVTTTTFPNKNLPQGQPIPAGFNISGSLQDEDNDVASFTNFMQLLAPPSPRLPQTAEMQDGQSIFSGIRCSACHIPMMTTGFNVISALSNQPVRLFSDLLLHHMGSFLADGIQQGLAAGDQFRTAPLWGLSHRSFFLHDGRATNLTDAIMSHGGEATAARTRFQSLTVTQRNHLLAFLGGL